MQQRFSHKILLGILVGIGILMTWATREYLVFKRSQSVTLWGTDRQLLIHLPPHVNILWKQESSSWLLQPFLSWLKHQKTITLDPLPPETVSTIGPHIHLWSGENLHRIHYKNDIFWVVDAQATKDDFNQINTLPFRLQSTFWILESNDLVPPLPPPEQGILFISPTKRPGKKLQDFARKHQRALISSYVSDGFFITQNPKTAAWSLATQQ